MYNLVLWGEQLEQEERDTILEMEAVWIFQISKWVQHGAISVEFTKMIKLNY
jgi:hypothetical protein